MPGSNSDEILNSQLKYMQWFEEAVKKYVDLDTESLVNGQIKAAEEWLRGD